MIRRHSSPAPQRRAFRAVGPAEQALRARAALGLSASGAPLPDRRGGAALAGVRTLVHQGVTHAAVAPLTLVALLTLRLPVMLAAAWMLLAGIVLADAALRRRGLDQRAAALAAVLAGAGAAAAQLLLRHAPQGWRAGLSLLLWYLLTEVGAELGRGRRHGTVGAEYLGVALAAALLMQALQ